MSNLRTPEQLTEYFNAFKLKKQKQKEKQSQRKKAKRQDEYKAIEKRLKEEKKEKVDKLINEHQQWLQSRKKQPIKQNLTLPNYDLNEEKLYTTRESLQQWEQEHYQCIQWENWNKLVQKTKNTLLLLF